MSSTRPHRDGLHRLACRAGLALSIALLALALWFHLQLDSIVRIPFVLACAGAGLMLGLNCLAALRSGQPKKRPANPGE